jgi:energy-coupling factor transporter ATP-binding protein EcfA2
MSTIDHLTKRYRNITAVDGLSFEVGSGRVTGFPGPNGAGKTATLRMLLGLARPDGGTATISGARTPATAAAVLAALHGRVADRRLAGCAAPGRDLTHPTQRWCPASSAAAGNTRQAHPENHHQRTAQPLPRLRRDIMHPMFKELFIDTDADALAAEDDRRRRVRWSRRARPAMITRPAARNRATRPRP